MESIISICISGYLIADVDDDGVAWSTLEHWVYVHAD